VGCDSKYRRASNHQSPSPFFVANLYRHVVYAFDDCCCVEETSSLNDLPISQRGEVMMTTRRRFSWAADTVSRNIDLTC
jgi:hypothetical protein